MLTTAIATALSLALGSACNGSLGTLPLEGTFEGTIRSGVSCRDSDGTWWQEMTFVLSDTTDVWMLFSATDDAELLLVGRSGGTLNTARSEVRDGRRWPGVVEASLLPGTYRLQVQTKRAGIRYSARLHRKVENGTIGACTKSDAAQLTSKSEFSAPLGHAMVGIKSACFDHEGHPALIRWFELDRPTDVAITVRPQEARATARIYVIGEGADVRGVAMSAEAGETARLTVPLGAGRWYLAFAADVLESKVDATVRRIESASPHAPPGERTAECADPGRVPAIAVGGSVRGYVSALGSCPTAGAGNALQLLEPYRLTVREPGTVRIEVESPSFPPLVALAPVDGEVTATDLNHAGRLGAAVVAELERGDYIILVGHARPTQTGSYTLRVR